MRDTHRKYDLQNPKIQNPKEQDQDQELPIYLPRRGQTRARAHRREEEQKTENAYISPWVGWKNTRNELFICLDGSRAW